jgi:hypothetical protein
MGMMSPLSSATGMNSAGDTGPRSGWVQRSRASAPTSWRPPSVKTGW